MKRKKMITWCVCHPLVTATDDMASQWVRNRQAAKPMWRPLQHSWKDHWGASNDLMTGRLLLPWKSVGPARHTIHSHKATVAQQSVSTIIATVGLSREGQGLLMHAVPFPVAAGTTMLRSRS